MLTIGAPGFAAFAMYAIIFGLLWRSLAFKLSARNPDSAIDRAMHFIY
jgi:hypothetical protein